MSYGELYIPSSRASHNAVNGKFLKGHVPHNKGKKWNEYASKRAQKRMAKGWDNLLKFRPETCLVAGKNKKEVIGVMDDGSWIHFPSMLSAEEWTGCKHHSSNVGRCCRMNHERHVNKKTGAINTDHKYMGVRFYFEDDNIWTTKIKQ